MSLIPGMSDREVRELAAKRQIERYGRLIDPELFDAGLALVERVNTGSRAIAVRSIALPTAIVRLASPFTVAAQKDPGYSAPVRARREGNALWLELDTAPRSKKNNSIYKFGATKAYKRFRDDVVGAIAAVRSALELPLPSPRPRDRTIGYNIAIRYYVDAYGKNADRPGLDQGLFDALVDAGVLQDDWYLRSTEGTSPPIEDDPQPRVELVITPLPRRAE